MYLKKIGCLFSNFSSFQPFSKDFSLFYPQTIDYVKLLLEDLHQQNEQVFLIRVSHCLHLRAVWC